MLNFHSCNNGADWYTGFTLVLLDHFTVEADPFEVEDTNMLKHLVWLHLNMQILLLVSQPKNGSEQDVNVVFMLSLLLIYQLYIPSKHRLIHQLFIIVTQFDVLTITSILLLIQKLYLFVCLYISLELQITLNWFNGLIILAWIISPILSHSIWSLFVTR